jgi:asparagine synthase (glutamine-hydrolysing)
MCGIIGVINLEKGILPTQKQFSLSLNMLESRGPDYTGIAVEEKHIFGHTRLSIIDLESQSNQPFTYINLTIVFNGEIYNYKQLKKDLQKKNHKFTTTSDTEVILHAYEEWGEKCVEKFIGMWAFCIYDKSKEKYFLSRDRIGEKPLVYFQTEDLFYFSSELPPLLGLLENVPKINYEALAQFNTYNFRHIPAPYTPYQNIYKLQPGHNLVVEKGKIKSYKYLKFEKIKNKKPSEVLRKCIQDTAVADVPVGILLSGGVDSSLIAAYSNKNHTCYTLAYNEQDPEGIRSKYIAKKLGLKHKIIYFEKIIEKESFVQLTRKNIEKYGEPLHLHQVIYSNLILQEMKKDGIKVVLGGNGADELFYGYDGQYTLYWVQLFKKIADKLHLWIFFPKYKYLRKNPYQIKNTRYHQKIQNKSYVEEKYRNFLYEDEMKKIASEIPSTKLVDVFSWLGLRIENEHSITIVSDLASSMNGMEIRSPFLHKHIIEYSLQLPIRKKLKLVTRRFTKFILKKDLEKYIRQYAYAKKRGFGFGFDITSLLENDKEEILAIVKNSKLKLFKLKDHYKIVEKYYNGERAFQNEVIEILCLALWYETYNSLAFKGEIQ